MIIRPNQLAFPLDPVSVFERPGPLILEIGFGDGNYLAHLGHREPTWNLLGVEMSMGSIWRAYRRMKREQIEHVRLFHGNARFILRDVIGMRSLHRVYVNFPDPWPRKKHAGNRLLNSAFFELASVRLSEGGAISLTTDHEDYFQFARDEAKKSGVFDEMERPAPESALQTKYALKWREQDRPIYHTLFTKIGEADEQIVQIQLVDMQHALLSGDLATISEFEKLNHHFDRGQVVVLEAFRELSGSGLLFKVLIEESDLRQEVIIQAWEKSDGIYVGLQQFGDPLGTRGVKEAVRVIVDWLVSQGMTLKQTWI